MLINNKALALLLVNQYRSEKERWDNKANVLLLVSQYSSEKNNLDISGEKK